MPHGKLKAANRKTKVINDRNDYHRFRMLEQLLTAKQAELQCAQRELEEDQQLLQVCVWQLTTLRRHDHSLQQVGTGWLQQQRHGSALTVTAAGCYLLLLCFAGCLDQVLGDFISTQEQFIPFLQQHMDWIEQLTAANSQDEALTAPAVHSRQQPSSTHQPQEQQPQQQQQQQQLGLHMLPASNITVGALPPRPLVPAGLGYMLRLVASATPQDLQRALQMTVGDMRQWHVQLFHSFPSLLVLASRTELRQAEHTSQAPACSSGAAGHSAAEGWQESAGSQQQQQQQQQPRGPADSCSADLYHNSSGAGAAPDAAAAAAAQSGFTFDTTEAAVEAAARQQLEACVDDFLRLSILLLFHNTTVPYMLAATNIATGVPAVGPPEHWLQVSPQHAGRALVAAWAISLRHAAAVHNCALAVRTACMQHAHAPATDCVMLHAASGRVHMF
jgi:hypothetical protein